MTEEKETTEKQVEPAEEKTSLLYLQAAYGRQAMSFEKIFFFARNTIMSIVQKDSPFFMYDYFLNETNNTAYYIKQLYKTVVNQHIKKHSRLHPGLAMRNLPHNENFYTFKEVEELKEFVKFLFPLIEKCIEVRNQLIHNAWDKSFYSEALIVVDKIYDKKYTIPDSFHFTVQDFDDIDLIYNYTSISVILLLRIVNAKHFEKLHPEVDSENVSTEEYFKVLGKTILNIKKHSKTINEIHKRLKLPEEPKKQKVTKKDKQLNSKANSATATQ